MSAIVEYLDRRFYPSFDDYWDAKLFRALVERHLTARTALLDFGAGRGAVGELDFRSPHRHIAAVDVDDAVLANPNVNEARLLSAGNIPYDDNQFDVVIAHDVLEHLPDPVTTFREIRRVLKPGGVFLGKTPNRWHYVAIVARLTPHWFHVWFNRLRGREEHDTFPTLYRANTRPDIARIAHSTGLRIERIEVVEGRPEYLRLNAVAYLWGLAYERCVNRFRQFAGLRAVIFVTLRKP